MKKDDVESTEKRFSASLINDFKFIAPVKDFESFEERL